MTLDRMLNQKERNGASASSEAKHKLNKRN